MRNGRKDDSFLFLKASEFSDELMGFCVSNPAGVDAMACADTHVDDVWRFEVCLRRV